MRHLPAWLLVWPLALPAAAPPPPRVDLYGDPLPPGAVARLGSARLRHAGLSDFVVLPDGKTVLTAGSDRVLRWWNFPDGRQSKEVRLAGEAGPGSLPTLSPDGKTLVAMDGEQLIFWDAATGKEVKRLPVISGRVASLCFSPDGGTLAVSQMFRQVLLWDWKAGKKRELPLPVALTASSSDSTTHATFSPDGKWLVARVNSDEPLCVFDLKTGREVHRLVCHARTSVVSPDGKTLIVSSRRNAGDEAVIRLFDLKTGKPLKAHPLGRAEDYHALAVSPDGKSLACGAWDRACLLDLATGRVLHRLTGRPGTMAFSRDGKTLVASSGRRLIAWDAVTGRQVPDPGDLGYTVAVAVTPDSRLLALADWMDPHVSVWETASGRLARRLPLGENERHVRNLAITPDGRTIFAFLYHGQIRSWDAATGRRGPSYRLHDADGGDTFYHFHPSPDGKSVGTLERILKRGEFTRLVRWDLASGKPRSQHLFAGEVREAAWPGDGTHAALCLRGGLSLIDAQDGTESFHVATPAAGPVASPDGSLIAALLSKGAVGVWEAATGKEVATFRVGYVTHLAIAAGSRRVVMADTDAFWAWDLADGRECWRWPLPTAGIDYGGEKFVHTLNVLPDGQRVFVALADGSGLILEIPTMAGRRAADEKALTAWWADLAAEDAKRACAAVWKLADAPPDVAVPFLRRHLRPSAGDGAIRKLIEELDRDEFSDREKAHKALAALGRTALPEIQAALAKKPPLEVQQRLTKLRAAARRAPLSGEERRGLRALQVLEGASSDAARRLLAELAKGAPHAPLTEAAAAALRRAVRR